MNDVVIVGAGHNGLVAAFYLARAGRKPLVLERRGMVGGSAVTEEIAPGCHAPTLAHSTGPLRAAIVRDMGLGRRVEFLRPEPRVVAPTGDGRALALSHDVSRTADAIRAFSEEDARRYPDFCRTLERMAAFLLPLLDRTPPSLTRTSPADVWQLVKIGRGYRALGRRDAYDLLRWMPMAVADLAAEWFTSDVLQAAVAARGIFGAAAGPWSAGTGAVMLLDAAADPVPGGSTIAVRGGPGALTRALADAAREAGATIRVDAPVAQITVSGGRASGVVLEDGTEIPARAVVSNADPRRTLLGLVDPAELDPGFLQRMQNYRAPGTVAKMNATLNGLPPVGGIHEADLRGRIHVGPGIDYLEQAFDASKYGQISSQPYLDITIPSLLDPSLCEPGKHVLSIYVQFTPYKLATERGWDDARDQLGAIVVRTLDRYLPGLSSAIEHRQILTPVDLERSYGLTGGHILHGEPSLDQLFSVRPVLGAGQYKTPVDGLFLCGAGTHPGGGVTGASGRNAAVEVLQTLKG